MTLYENYLSQMKRLKASLPYMSEKDFCEAHGLQYGDEEIAPLILHSKQDQHKKSASLETFIKNAESTKRKRSIRINESLPKKLLGARPPKMSDEELKANRLERQAKRRADFKAKGLTTKGIPPKPRKEGMTKKEMAKYKSEKIQEQRAIWKAQGLNNKGEPFKKPTKEQRLEYAKKYQSNHREKHLEYRKKWREENKEKVNDARRKNTITV